MEKYLIQMDSILTKLFAKYRETIQNPGVLLSGGIDSSVITSLISTNFSDYDIYSMGTGETKDRNFITLLSDHLSHPYEWVEITENKISQHMKTVDGLLTQEGIEIGLMQRSLAMGYFLIFESAKQKGVTHIFTGQGPDILLGGYHKYESIQDINLEIKKDLPLLEVDKKRDLAMAKYFGITLINPYLTEEFIEFSLGVPQEYKIKNGAEKYILREYAKSKKLPSEIINRPKKAFQYSTGIQKIIHKMYYGVK